MDIVGFDFNGSSVRTVLQDNGELFWVAKDVCDVLGYSNSRDAVEKLDEDEYLVSEIPTSGQKRKMQCVNESGLYTLIFRSNKEIAKMFRRWVTHEVLPTIRKQGVYTTHAELQDKFAKEVEEYREKVAELETQVYDLKEELDEDAKEDRRYMLERQNQIKASIKLFMKRYTKRGDSVDFHELYGAYQNSCSAKGEPVGTQLEFESVITTANRFVFERLDGRFIAHIELDKAAMRRDFRHHYKEWAPQIVESQKPKKKTKKDDGIPIDGWKGKW